MKKKYSYYNVDLGFFPRCVKLCFNDEQFQEILIDQKMTNVDIKALQLGVAEVHYIGEGKKGVIIAVFNLDDMKDSVEEMVATIAHETVHIIERLSEYIEEEEILTEETRAYLTESIVRQIFKACVIEKEKHVGKTLGTVLENLGGKIRGLKLQMDKHSDRRTRQNRIPKGESIPSGTKGKVRPTISKTITRVQPTGKTRIQSNRTLQRGRS